MLGGGGDNVKLTHERMNLVYPPEIKKIAEFPSETLAPCHVAKVVGMAAVTIRYLAINEPDRLPFPCITSSKNSRVRIPKWPFLNSFGYYMTNGGDAG